MNANRVFIFDTTLRDGQQSPGAGMSFEDNIKYADYAESMRIDVLEAGFPAASQTDFDIVDAISKKMAEKKSQMTIAGLCQLREAQVIKTMEALRPSVAINKARIHTYFPVDPHLIQASVGDIDKNKIIKTLYRLVKIATDEGFEVEFSPEGYSRMGVNFDFTSDLIRSVVSAGGVVINCPDTIGGAGVEEGDDYFVRQMQKHADIISKEFPEREIIWSAHCHNDFGLALTNSINAVFNGPARQIEGCMNGVGERAGNAAIEQCIMVVKHFGERANPNNPFYTDINHEHIKASSDFISEKMLSRQAHFPIVGENSARHSSGGHTNAILKNPMAYQPFDPKTIGSEISFVFGPLSGSNHAKRVIEQNGYHCANDAKVEITQGIKNYYSDRRKGVTDDELMKGFYYVCSPIKAERISYAKSSENKTTLSISGQFFNDEDIIIDYEGKNSSLAALAKAVETHFPGIAIIDYRSNSEGENTVNAKCHSRIKISINDSEMYYGEAVDSDIEISALKAFINVVNKAYVEQKYKNEANQYA